MWKYVRKIWVELGLDLAGSKEEKVVDACEYDRENRVCTARREFIHYLS
jgi:hypothetical protein